MVTYREAGELLLKAALSGTGMLTRMSGLISALVLLLFGFEWSPLKDLAAHNFGPPVIRLVTGSGIAFYVVASFRAALNSYHERSAINHYQISRQARKERAYRAIHRLKRDGIFIKTTDPQRRQKWIDWDKEVIKAIVDNCNRWALQFYLTRTDRSGDGGASMLIDEGKYDEAIATLKMFIDDDFKGFLD